MPRSENIQPLAPISAQTSRRVSRPLGGNNRGEAGRVAAIRAQSLALAIEQAPQALQPTLAPLSTRDLVATRHVAYYFAAGKVSEAQVLRLLPPLVVAQIQNARSKALLKFLLAWGESLREQAALDRVAAKRNQAKATETKRNQATVDARRVLAQSQTAALRQIDPMDSMVGGMTRLSVTPALRAEVARPMGVASLRAEQGAPEAPAGLGFIVSGLNLPMTEALTPPMRSGFTMRPSALRFVQD